MLKHLPPIVSFVALAVASSFFIPLTMKPLDPASTHVVSDGRVADFGMDHPPTDQFKFDERSKTFATFKSRALKLISEEPPKKVKLQETTPILDFPQSTVLMFGIAEVEQGGISVNVSIKGGGEIRVQPYKESVPVTKMIEGEGGKPQRFITELRKVAKKRFVYHGMKMEAAGTMKEPPVYSYPKDEHVTYRLEDCKFFDLRGKPVNSAEVATRLGRRSPILIVTDEMSLDPFYRAALNKQTLLFVPPPAEEKQEKGPLPQPTNN